MCWRLMTRTRQLFVLVFNWSCFIFHCVISEQRFGYKVGLASIKHMTIDCILKMDNAKIYEDCHLALKTEFVW